MSLINKYNINEKDQYQLGIIESKKKSSGLFEKEKLKAASLKILKPYNVKFMDLGNLLSEIKNGDLDIKFSEKFSDSENFEIDKLIKENSNVTNFYKEWWSKKSKKQKWLLIIGIILVVFYFGKLGDSNNTGYYSENSNNDSGYSPNTESSICSYCGKSYTGSGYNDALGMGRSYCSGFCYVDAN